MTTAPSGRRKTLMLDNEMNSVCTVVSAFRVYWFLLLTVSALGRDVDASAQTSTSRLTATSLAADTSSLFHQTRQRLLEDGNNNNVNGNYNEYFGYDLANFSLRFERCQYIKTFDTDAVEQQYMPDPFSIRHFIVFQLCPSDTCSSDCSTVAHGQYVVEADEYLQATVEEQAKRFEEMCNECEDDCFYQVANDDGQGGAAAADGDEANNNNVNYDASACLSSKGCGRLCYLQQNLEANGYVDAADYLECQAVDMQNYYNKYGFVNDDDDVDGDDAYNGDADDDGYQFQLYIGPRCSKYGNKVILGLFSDQYCLTPFTDLKPEEVLGYEISYAMLQHTLANNGSNCLSCKEDADNYENNNANDQADADNVNEMCETVYADAGKCETKYGIAEGFIQTNIDGGNHQNQVENEYRVCKWIESLMLDAYTESGEINLQGDTLTIYREVTPLQKTTFSLLTLTVASLIAAGVYTQRQIEKSLPKIDLSSQSDAIIT